MFESSHGGDLHVRKQPHKGNSTQVAISNSSIMKNIGDERNDLNKDKSADEQIVHDNSNEANSKNPDENYIIEDDEDYYHGKVDMAEVFPNTDDNPIEYIYTRDSTGRVISVDFRLKVPRNEVEFIRSHDENGGIVDVECRFKKTGEDDTTGN